MIDVADPQTPVELGSLPGFRFVDVEVEGSQAHAAGRDSAVIDVSDPMQPSMISQEIAGNDVELRNGVRYVATSSGFATSAGGSLLVQAPEGVWDVELAGSQAWLAHYFWDKPWVSAQAKLELLDVSDPGSPEVLGILPYHRFESLRDVAVADGLAYVGMRGALSVVDFGPEYVPEPEPLPSRLAALATLVLLAGGCRRVRRGSGA